MFGYAEAAAQWQRAIELEDAAQRQRAIEPEDAAQRQRAIELQDMAADRRRAGGADQDSAYSLTCPGGTCGRSTRGIWPGTWTAPGCWPRRPAAGSPRPRSGDRGGSPRARRAVPRHRRRVPGRAGPARGIPLITEALGLFDQAPPSAEHAEALFYYGHYLFTGEGRHEEGIRVIRRGLAIAEAAGATALIPRMQPLLAFDLFLAGQIDEGFAVLRRGRALAESAGDGEACVLIDVYESDALLKTARVTEAAEVALTGLASARQAGLEAFWTTAILAANGAEALLHQARTADAAALIGPLTDGPAGRDTWLAHAHRAEIDLLLGDTAGANARQEQIAAIVGQVESDDWSREGALRAAELWLWDGAPDRALPGSARPSPG